MKQLRTTWKILPPCVKAFIIAFNIFVWWLVLWVIYSIGAICGLYDNITVDRIQVKSAPVAILTTEGEYRNAVISPYDGHTLHLDRIPENIDEDYEIYIIRETILLRKNLFFIDIVSGERQWVIYEKK